MATPYPSNDHNILTPCLRIDQELFILVKPSFASGIFGHCSVWMGVSDKKLYVRKLITTHPTADRPPRYMERHHNNLSMVPKLVACIKHEPVPVRVGQLGPGKFMTSPANVKQFWSATYEYVPGRDLKSILQHASHWELPIPEPMIWEFGRVMLEFIDQLLCLEEAQVSSRHHDLHAGNIIVSNDLTGKRSCNFHIIDFGLSTSEVDQPLSSKDLNNICQLLKHMMQCNLPESMQHSKDINKWTRMHFKALDMAVESLYGVALHPWNWMQRQYIAEHKEHFEQGARDSFQIFKEDNHEYSIDVSERVIKANPVFWRNRVQPSERMSEHLRDQTGVYPCYRAWASDSGPVENWVVEDQVLWGNPKHDPAVDSFA